MVEPQVRERVRESPRISLNALTEYLVASPARRHSILREQKRPPAYQVTYYREVEEAIANAIAGEDDAPLQRCRLALANLQGSDYEQTRRLNGLSALDAISTVVRELPLRALNRRIGPSRPRRLQIEGVPVSVRPEVLLESSTDPHRLGAIKLYFSATKPLTDDRARYAGSVLWRYVRATAGDAATADHRLCFLVDVIAGRWFTAPRTYRRRSQDVEAACREIRALWPFA
jgi:hypothetical protein